MRQLVSHRCLTLGARSCLIEKPATVVGAVVKIAAFSGPENLQFSADNDLQGRAPSQAPLVSRSNCYQYSMGSLSLKRTQTFHRMQS